MYQASYLAPTSYRKRWSLGESKRSLRLDRGCYIRHVIMERRWAHTVRTEVPSSMGGCGCAMSRRWLLSKEAGFFSSHPKHTGQPPGAVHKVVRIAAYLQRSVEEKLQIHVIHEESSQTGREACDGWVMRASFPSTCLSQSPPTD